LSVQGNKLLTSFFGKQRSSAIQSVKTVNKETSDAGRTVQPQEVFSLIADSIEKAEKDKVVIKTGSICTYM